VFIGDLNEESFLAEILSLKNGGLEPYIKVLMRNSLFYTRQNALPELHSPPLLPSSVRILFKLGPFWACWSPHQFPQQFPQMWKTFRFPLVRVCPGKNLTYHEVQRASMNSWRNSDIKISHPVSFKARGPFDPNRHRFLQKAL